MWKKKVANTITELNTNGNNAITHLINWKYVFKYTYLKNIYKNQNLNKCIVEKKVGAEMVNIM